VSDRGSDLLALIWTTFLLLALPLQSIVTRRLLVLRRPTRMLAYRSSVSGLLAMGLVTLLVDLLGPRTGWRAVTTGLSTPALLEWTLGALAVCVAVSLGVLLLRKAIGQPLDAKVVALLPRTRSELLAFAGVSIVSGAIEEYVMRGFCLGLLSVALRSAALAFVLVTLSFGLAHGYQGRVSMLRATALGAVLAGPVLSTGAVVPSMITHGAVNLLSGLWTYPLARRWHLVD